MTDPFESPKFLVRQTKEDIEIFQAECTALFSGECCSDIIDVDPITKFKTYKIKFARTIPEKLRSIANNALTNLRNSFDQGLCCAVRNATGTDVRSLYFPFRTNPNDLNGYLGTEAYKIVPDEIKAVLRSLHPYPTGQEYEGGNDLLAAFSNASGPNKHQTTLSIAGHVSSYGGDSITGDLVHYMEIPPRWDVRYNQLIIGVTKPEGYIKYQLDLTLEIIFGNAGKLTGLPIYPVLDSLCLFADAAIYDLESASIKLRAFPF